MICTLPEQMPRAETLHYLGAGGWQPDAAVDALLDRAEQALRQNAAPRAVWRELPLDQWLPWTEGRCEDGTSCGEDLRRHLAGCCGALLFAATLGTGVDRLLCRLELTDIALAAVTDAMAGALLEQVCDALHRQLQEEHRQQGRYLTSRFAPGYGDCPLELNDEIALLADTVRGCGLTVTPQHLLAPRKSTTGIAGVADHPVTGALAGCANCKLRQTCAYRKRGTTCASI